MGLRFSLFSVPEHRVFNYQPRFYDPVKEDLQQRIANAKREKEIEEAQASGSEGDEHHYVPGQYIRGSFHRSYEVKRSRGKGQRPIQIISVLCLAVLIALVLYFSNAIGLLWKLIL